MRSRIAAPHYPCTAPLKPSAVNNPDQRLQCLGPTAKPCLPIRHSLPNVSPLELLPSRADLAIRLQAAYDEGTFLLREETRGIREVLDDEEREYASYDGDEALYDENPGPAKVILEACHYPCQQKFWKILECFFELAAFEKSSFHIKEVFAYRSM